MPIERSCRKSWIVYMHRSIARKVTKVTKVKTIIIIMLIVKLMLVIF